jgi:hypothetical protein
MINWSKCSKEDMLTIHEIAKRAGKRDMVSLEMDITACHINNPLDLKGLLGAKDFDFYHDINGIMACLDRNTGRLTNCFVPRYSKKGE